MDKEIQDLVWKCLPKEARDEKRNEYRIVSKNPQLDRGDSIYLTALENIFGRHNLDSDTEPEEMLVVERKKVMERYHDLKYPSDAGYNQTLRNANILLLQDLFGVDKCLPDKEEPKPRFKVGDKVIAKNSNQILIIEGIRYDSQKYDCGGFGFVPWDNSILEPYTEENKEPIVSKDDTMDDTKETMKEKELNLCELLAYQDLSGTYSPIYGEVRVTDIACDSLVITPEHSSDNNIELFPDGRFSKNGDCLLYPSRALYEKYPLDAYSAWMEWRSERKPKRWRAKLGEKYWVVDIELSPTWSEEKNDGYDKVRYNNGNYFRTEEDAQQAAEAVRETLEKFHESHTEQ